MLLLTLKITEQSFLLLTFSLEHFWYKLLDPVRLLPDTHILVAKSPLIKPKDPCDSALGIDRHTALLNLAYFFISENST